MHQVFLSIRSLAEGETAGTVIALYREGRDEELAYTAGRERLGLLRKFRCELLQ